MLRANVLRPISKRVAALRFRTTSPRRSFGFTIANYRTMYENWPIRISHCSTKRLLAGTRKS